jgi:vitamin B12 transporter
VIKRTAILLFILFSIFCIAIPSFSMTQEEKNFLLLYFKPEELNVTSTTRSLKSISRVAENVEVVTASDIEMMNAHTLTDVLNTIPGVQIDLRGGPGSAASARIQGSDFRHVLILIDGVTLNNLSDNIADISAVPVQDIERVEIIKGPASSSWGSSLGGVINIITKSTGKQWEPRGTLSASYGERNTGDYRVETSGGSAKAGYYLSVGNLVSDGFEANTDFYENNLYAKFRWDVTDRAKLLFTFGYNKGSRGQGQYTDLDLSFGDGFEYLFSTLSLNYALTDQAGLDISLRTSRQNGEFVLDQLSTGEELQKSYSHDRVNGGSLKFNWKNEIQSVVLGADLDNGELRSDSIKDGEQDIEKWAVFGNDTVSIGKFSVTPGLRYDHTSTNGDFLSPSLGMTYRLSDKTLLRAYAARGFNIPPLSATFGTGFFSLPNPDLKVEKVWSVQAGIESAVSRYFWLKADLFRHDIDDALVNEQFPDGSFTTINEGKQRRQGAEVEIKTASFYNTSLSAGLAFTDATDRDTGEVLKEVPRYTYDIGVTYNDNKSFSALLKGHYIWWNAAADDQGRYNAFVWDLNVRKKVYSSRTMHAELFVEGHNIFNGSQYVLGPFRNPSRWVEGGLRIKFL